MHVYCSRALSSPRYIEVAVVHFAQVHLVCYNCGYCLVMGKSRNIMRGPTTVYTKKIMLVGTFPPPPLFLGPGETAEWRNSGMAE